MLVMFSAGWLVATLRIGRAVDPASLSTLERQFTDQMKGAAMVGRFTVAGREDRQANPDRYDISSVEKVGDDQWRFGIDGLENFHASLLRIDKSVSFLGIELVSTNEAPTLRYERFSQGGFHLFLLRPTRLIC